jgi:hypothetical protein
MFASVRPERANDAMNGADGLFSTSPALWFSSTTTTTCAKRGIELLRTVLLRTELRRTELGDAEPRDADRETVALTGADA